MFVAKHEGMRRSDLPISNPCPRKFSTLERIDDARGHCDDCNLTVHNLSALPEKEALEVWKQRQGHFCVNYKCDEEGNVLFADSPPKSVLVPITQLTSKRKAATIAASLILAACGAHNNEATGAGSVAPSDAAQEPKGDAGMPPKVVEYGGGAPADLRDASPVVVEPTGPDAGADESPDASTPDGSSS